MYKMFGLMKAKDFHFANPPDKNNKKLNRILDLMLEKLGCVTFCNNSCPFESKGHDGCFALHTEECVNKGWKERIEIYKKMFYNNIVQEEFEV